MSVGEFIVRSTIWAALFLYTVSELGRVRWRRSRSGEVGLARWLSTIGCVLFLVHVVSAFHVFHNWNHGQAYRFTAEETERFVGLRWGGGLFVNYGFMALWVGEALAWWRAEELVRSRASWIDGAIRFVFGFMILNGAVIFVDGPQRWAGVILVSGLVWAGMSGRPEGRRADKAT